jgi:hypothetical protein
MPSGEHTDAVRNLGLQMQISVHTYVGRAGRRR